MKAFQFTILAIALIAVILTLIFEPALSIITFGFISFGLLIDRSGAAALIPEEVSREIIQDIPANSAVLSLFKRLPNMTRAQQRMPVLSLFPSAYFVNGDTGQKVTTRVNWDNKYLNAEEIAVIVPIPEAVLDDADYDIWAEVRPRLLEAIGVTVDGAVLHGVNAPASWPDDIVTAATAAGNVVALGTGADIYDDIMGEGGVLNLVELDGFGITGHIAAMSMKAKLRGLRSSDGIPIFVKDMAQKTGFQLDGEPCFFPKNGGLNPNAALLISGDFNNAVFSIRQDITYKLLTEATLYDTDGVTPLYRLAEQDMVALRVVIRLAWQVPNPINRLQPTESLRYPFAVLSSGAGS